MKLTEGLARLVSLDSDVVLDYLDADEPDYRAWARAWFDCVMRYRVARLIATIERKRE